MASRITFYIYVIKLFIRRWLAWADPLIVFIFNFVLFFTYRSRLVNYDNVVLLTEGGYPGFDSLAP